MRNSHFENGFSYTGVALQFIKSNPEGFLRITGTTFHNNTAVIGGAIYSLGGLLVDNCTFTYNRAYTKGSDIYFESVTESPKNVTIKRSQFMNIYGLAINLICLHEHLSEHISFEDSIFRTTNLESKYVPYSFDTDYVVSAIAINSCINNFFRNTTFENL